MPRLTKLSSLHWSFDTAGPPERDSTKILQDLEAQLVALKVRLAHAERKPAFLPLVDSRPDVLRPCCPHSDTQAQPHSFHRQHPVRVRLHCTPTFLPLAYYAVESQCRGENDRLISCKSFPVRASDSVADLESIVDRSVSKLLQRHCAPYDYR